MQQDNGSAKNCNRKVAQPEWVSFVEQVRACLANQIAVASPPDIQMPALVSGDTKVLFYLAQSKTQKKVSASSPGEVLPPQTRDRSEMFCTGCQRWQETGTGCRGSGHAKQQACTTMRCAGASGRAGRCVCALQHRHERCRHLHPDQDHRAAPWSQGGAPSSPMLSQLIAMEAEDQRLNESMPLLCD